MWIPSEGGQLTSSHLHPWPPPSLRSLCPHMSSTDMYSLRFRWSGPKEPFFTLQKNNPRRGGALAGRQEMGLEPCTGCEFGRGSHPLWPLGPGSPAVEMRWWMADSQGLSRP